MAGQGEALNLEELALEFLQGASGAEVEENPSDEGAAVEHPAWQAILDAVPAEYHAALTPTLKDWDTGVSRKFQKIHDEYEPYKRFGEYDPEMLETAASVYQQLLDDPAATWDTIGKAFGLSPQTSPQSGSSSDEDFDGLELPEALKARLAKLDDHDRVLDLVTSELLERRKVETEALEDQELRKYLDSLYEEYGDFDVDYVTSLLAVGIDGDEAIERYHQITGTATNAPVVRAPAPKVMSSTGGVPTSTGNADLSKLSNQDTKALVEQILRLAAQE